MLFDNSHTCLQIIPDNVSFFVTRCFLALYKLYRKTFYGEWRKLLFRDSKIRDNTVVRRAREILNVSTCDRLLY
jgi:hypothetical protein